MMSTADDNNNVLQLGGSGEMMSSKNECDQNNIDNITKGINSVTVSDVTSCANCGKEGNSDDMNTCNKCKSVKYCNAACKKKHRKKHKKACERRVAELYEEALFKEVEPEECPICMLTMPFETYTTTFQSCCGKLICNGCIYAMKISEGKDLCAFCRTPPTRSHEKNIKQLNKLMDKGNAEAFNMFGGWYRRGDMGLPQDDRKANELYLKAGELGCADGYYNSGLSYRDGNGVEADQEKAKHYYELAAMGGCLHARHNIGAIEYKAGNYQRAYKHFMIAAKAGYDDSLHNVKVGFKNGYVTKDDYTNSLRAYHERQKEMKSDERDNVEVHVNVARSRKM